MGTKVQEYLVPFLLHDPQPYSFYPAEAEAERYRRLNEERGTPLSYGNMPGSNRRDEP